MRHIERSNWDIEESIVTNVSSFDTSRRGRSVESIQDPTPEQNEELIRELYPVAMDVLLRLRIAGLDLFGTPEPVEGNVTPAEEFVARRLRREAR